MLGLVSKFYTGLLRIVSANAIIAGPPRMDIWDLADSASVRLEKGLLPLPMLMK